MFISKYSTDFLRRLQNLIVIGEVEMLFNSVEFLVFSLLFLSCIFRYLRKLDIFGY